MSDAETGRERADDEPRLPTREELQGLPRWARVAFAARCARRVQPLFKLLWPEAPRKHIAAVDRAITLAELLAADPASARDDLDAAVRAVYAACTDAWADNNESAAFAAQAAGEAAYAAQAAYTDTDAAAATDVVAHAIKATYAHTHASAFVAARAAIYRDYRMLWGTTMGGPFTDVNGELVWDKDGDLIVIPGSKPWDDNTPVSVSLLGPLWPFGEPEEWPDRQSTDIESHALPTEPSEQQVVLKLRLPPLEDTPENRQRLRQELRSLVKATSELHIAHGGSGLRAKRLRAFVPKGSPQPSGGEP